MNVLGLTLLPGGIDPWSFLLLGAVSTLLLGAAKSGFGGDIGLLAVPLMIYACGGDSVLALGLMLPLLIACDYIAVVSWWRSWNIRSVLLLLPGALVGVLIAWLAMQAIASFGAASQKHITDALLKLGIGTISLGFVAMQVVASFRAARKAFSPDIRHGSTIGLAAGLTSTFAHAAGPIIAMYMIPQQMPKGKYVSSTVLFFWILNQIKLGPYFALDMINTQSLLATVTLLPAVAGGAIVGLALHKRVQQKHFSMIVHVLLVMASVHLVVRALQSLFT